MRTLIVITGPTAVGKTEICLDIAKRYHVPIINADSRQIYQGMVIGTAAPTMEQLAAVKHYFVGVLSPDKYYNASMFEQDVTKVLHELWGNFQGCSQDKQSRQLALVCGGSMMYIDSVCDGIDDIPTIHPETRAMIRDKYEKDGLERLLEELKLLDPEYYDVVDKRNQRRVVHGLEICYQTGKTYTSFRKREKIARPFDRLVKIFINRSREQLYKRINTRVDRMIENGLEAEVRSLENYRGVNALNSVGYREMFDYIDEKITLNEAVEKIKSNTRRYARKQQTWYKRDENIRWFDAEDKEGIIEYIENAIR